MNGVNYANVAVQWAERCGIVEYRIVKTYFMVYNVSFSAYLSNPHYTVQHTVDLRTLKETTKVLKRFDPKGYNNR